MSHPTDPRPRETPGNWETLGLSCSREVALPEPELSEVPFSVVMEQRRSRRRLTRAPFNQVARWLATALAARSIGQSALSRSHRPALSAGAIHPVDVVWVRGRVTPVALYYDAVKNSVARVSVDRRLIKSALEACSAVLPEASGDFVFLLASTSKTAAYYSDPQSLYWRDAGAVLQTLALTAELFNLGFCPLGTLGSEILSALGIDRSGILAVGVGAIGIPVN